MPPDVSSVARTPTTIYFSFSAGTLPEGKYQANLVIKAPSRNITRTVPITFTLNDVPKIVFSPAQVAFKYRCLLLGRAGQRHCPLQPCGQNAHGGSGRI